MTSKVDSGRPLPPNATPEHPWTAMERCVHCGAVALRPLTEREFGEWWRTTVPDAVICDRCRADPR